jgi:3-methylcrotonyl-CoA carboxylase alpha subunit
VQVFGDSTGNVVSFGTRDCSSQRKHQKVIEEGPAPFLSADLSAKIEAAAVKVAKAVGYQNAGTSEFLVSGERFFFLEMNTRIQVEHPVTEEVTGTDLVALQFRIAAGEKLSEIAPSRAKHGHAIELRLYAEDPAQNYAPSLGVITHLDLLDGAADAQSWLRIERGFEAGDEITPYYDAMIAKIIVTGDSRAEAIHHAQRAIRQISVGGIRTNQAFLAWLLHESPFRDAPIDITFIDRMWDERSVELANDILLRDPCHGSLTRSENVQHEERCFVAGHPVSLVHEMGATFLATALTKPELSIRSNGRTAALQALEERLRG